MSNLNLPPLPGPPRRLNRPASTQPAPAVEPEAVTPVVATPQAPATVPAVTLPELQQPAPVPEVASPTVESTGDVALNTPVNGDETTPTLIAPAIPAADNLETPTVAVAPLAEADTVAVAGAATRRGVFRKKVVATPTSPFSVPVTGSAPAEVDGFTLVPSEPHTIPGEPYEERIITETKVSGPHPTEKKKASRGFVIALIILGAALTVAALAWLAVTLFPSILGGEPDPVIQPPAVVEILPSEGDAETPTEEAPAAPVEEAPAEGAPAAPVTPPVEETVTEETPAEEAPAAPEGELLQESPSAGTESDNAWDEAFASLDPAPATITVDQGRWLASETCRQLEADTPAEDLTNWLAGLAADTAEVGAVAEAGVSTYCPAETPELLAAYESVDA